MPSIEKEEMTLRDYKASDVYIGKWHLDVQERPAGAVERTQYNVYRSRGTCFVDMVPPEGGSVCCMTGDGKGMGISMWSEGVNRWCGDSKTHILPLMGVSFHFAMWMPGLFLCPSEVPLADAWLTSHESEYDAVQPPHEGKRFVGLLDDELLIAMKYLVGDRLHVEARVAVQKLATFGDK